MSFECSGDRINTQGQGWPARGIISKRYPTLLRTQMHITNIDSLPPSHTEPNGGKYDAACTIVVHTNTADEIQTAVHAGETLKCAFYIGQLIHQHKCLGGIAAHVEPD